MIRRALQRLAGRHPHAAVTAATAIGAVTRRWAPDVEPAAIRRMLPDLSDAEMRSLQAALWTGWLRLRVLEAAMSSPTADWPYPRLAEGVAVPSLEPPVIVAGFHLGPIPALGILLERLPGETLVVHLSGPPRPGLTMRPVGGDRWGRAADFRQAIDTLRAGGSVFLLVDANELPATVEIELFGQRTGLARGAFALSRMTGAPVVPVAPRWRGSRVEILAGDPIGPGEEGEMAAVAARWLEEFIRANPQEIGRLLPHGIWN